MCIAELPVPDIIGAMPAILKIRALPVILSLVLKVQSYRQRNTIMAARLALWE